MLRICTGRICVLVRAGATAAAAVLRPYLATYGIATRAQDALQDLLAEPLTSVVVDVMAGLPLIEGSLTPDNYVPPKGIYIVSRRRCISSRRRRRVLCCVLGRNDLAQNLNDLDGAFPAGDFGVLIAKGIRIRRRPNRRSGSCKVAERIPYLARAKDPPPGNAVMWRGLTRLTDIQLGFILGAQLVGN